MKGAKENLHNQRKNYDKYSLSPESAQENPFSQFDIWYKEAAALKTFEANAFVLSTASNNIPKSRVVLLKEYAASGFVFFTNYNSQKGKDILNNPIVSLLFFYEQMQRQIRVLGKAERVSEEQSDAYFYSRPLKSQYGAMLSAQSDELKEDANLEDELAKLVNANKKPQRPKHWGGYIVKASSFEFWQGRPSRLHDRICYEKSNNSWRKFRVAP